MTLITLISLMAATKHQEVWSGKVGNCRYRFQKDGFALYFKGQNVWKYSVDWRDNGDIVYDSKSANRFFVLAVGGVTTAFTSNGKFLFRLGAGECGPYPFFVSRNGVVVNGTGALAYSYDAYNLEVIDWHNQYQEFQVFDQRGKCHDLPSLKVIGFPFFANERYSWSFRPRNWASAASTFRPTDFWLIKYDYLAKSFHRYPFRLSHKQGALAMRFITGSGPEIDYYNEKTHWIATKRSRKWCRLRMPRLGGL